MSHFGEKERVYPNQITISNYAHIELFRYIESKLKYICFVSIDLAMYNMQITSYNANLSFFMDEFIIYVIIQHTKSLSMCFLLKI